MSASRDEASKFSAFMRYFSTRVVQSVVQARMGQLISHKCSSKSPEESDWFNLIVDEIGEISAYLKSSIRKYPPNCPALTLDFLLYTADGDSLPLESWAIRIDKNHIGENVNVHTTLYHQMSTLLKSIIIASHCTPTYRYYVRKQSPDTFVIFYRVFEGEPDLSLLGEVRKYRRLGFLPTPFGTINVDLYYRTRMEILPPPFVENTEEASATRKEELEEQQHRQEQASTTVEGNFLFNQASIPYGNVVPPKGSETVAVSPVLEDINSFSTSPLSQDLPFVDNKSHFTLGRSTSSTDESTSGVRHPSRSSKSDNNSPSSFPQRSASYRQLRIRNNSFPFASLLIDSQSSATEQQTRSQLLPKVPEDGTIGLHSSKSDRILESKGYQHRLLSSLTNALPSSGTIMETTSEDHPSVSGNDKEFPLHIEKKVVFGCSAEDSTAKPSDEASAKDEDDRMSEDSDDSYVKVIAFASCTDSEDLGSDLSEFVKEVRLAPESLHSFSVEQTNILSRQLDAFKERATMFNSFVAGLKEAEEE